MTQDPESSRPEHSARPGDPTATAPIDTAPIDTAEPAAVEAGADRFRRIALALSLPLIAVLAIIIGAKIVGPGPDASAAALPVSTVYQPGADAGPCKDLLSALPAGLAGGTRRTLEGQTDGVAAWGDPAIILRCGLPTPAELTCSSYLTSVDSVDWLQLQGTGQTTYLAADRSVRIALTIPDGTPTAAIQDISRIVAGTVAEQEVCTKGVLTPTTDH